MVLEDSTVVVGTPDDTYEVVVHDRLAQLDLPESRHYRSRLGAGSGYDAEHRAILAELQRKERLKRNRDGGYWIAEADPRAANHALVAHYPRPQVGLVALATDGAADMLAPLGISWLDVARLDRQGLPGFLPLRDAGKRTTTLTASSDRGRSVTTTRRSLEFTPL